MFLGNLIGLGFGWIQDSTRLIRLDPENYNMSYVPVYWDWTAVLGLNILILIITTAVLFIPAMIISNVNPIKAIRFD
jgi:lipoprotein-releasing system permease protein